MGDRCVAATSLRCCGGTPGDQDGRGTNELSKIESILGTRMSQNLSRDRRLACWLAKVFLNRQEIGQTASRTIDRQHTQPPPTLLCDLLIGRIQQNIVQCDQCLGLKLLPGAAEGRFGYRGNGCWIIRRCPPWRAKRRRVVPGSREATRDTRRAEGAKGDPKGASERGVQSYGRPVCSSNELAMLWRNAG